MTFNFSLNRLDGGWRARKPRQAAGRTSATGARAGPSPRRDWNGPCRITIMSLFTLVALRRSMVLGFGGARRTDIESA
jgi:hypothetical protein